MKRKPAEVTPKEWSDLFSGLRNTVGRFYHSFFRVLQINQNNPISIMELEKVKPTICAGRDIQGCFPALNYLISTRTIFPYRLGMATYSIRKKRGVVYRPGSVCFFSRPTLVPNKKIEKEA